jgi:hypothetical protein
LEVIKKRLVSINSDNFDYKAQLSIETPRSISFYCKEMYFDPFSIAICVKKTLRAQTRLSMSSRKIE